MRLSALKHLVAATQALSRCERIRVLGSSALLASFPELGEAGQPLELSYDADLLVEPCDEQLAAMLHEALGEGSLFAQRSGYHADFLRPSITETLPSAWESRLVPLELPGKAGALSPADLTVVKLRLGRPKDLELCRHLLRQKMVEAGNVHALLDTLPMEEPEMVRVWRRWREVSG